ncbi:DUF3231 family protein [Brevibacillus migulae]|uniref:DUF3231 family protein n=1 Tax=Brevibacillus migulae TaxID=1644114 RepID=UPI00142FC621|nr:DUF3231 family protein [Brevibacillus migulae]
MEKHKQMLTSSEIAHLWISYMVDDMAQCCLQYFLHKCEDENISSILQYALHLSQRHVQTVTSIFESEAIPIPIGFTDQDKNLDAPRLFSDAFVLLYLHQLANTGLTYYSKALAMATREDVHQFYTACISSSTELNARTKHTLLSKGLYVRSPYVPIPEKAEMTEKLGFLKGFLGEQRSITVMEIACCFSNLQSAEVVKTLMIGFSQVAKAKDVKDFFQRGKQIALKQSELFRGILTDEDLAASIPWDTYISDTTIAPFSDKLMMFHGAMLTGAGIEQFGFSLATSMRRDLGVRYSQLLAEMLTYADDGANLMIKNGWLEQIPLAADRFALQHSPV